MATPSGSNGSRASAESERGESRGRQRLIALAEQHERFQDFIIVHELLRFFVPNHGKLWKSLMRAHLGDYGRMEAKLMEGRRVLR